MTDVAQIGFSGLRTRALLSSTLKLALHSSFLDASSWGGPLERFWLEWESFPELHIRWEQQKFSRVGLKRQWNLPLHYDQRIKEMERALKLAQSIDPEFQVEWVSGLQKVAGTKSEGSCDTFVSWDSDKEIYTAEFEETSADCGKESISERSRSDRKSS